MPHQTSSTSFFFFNDTATTEIYTLSLHDALPIYFWRNNVLGHACLSQTLLVMPVNQIQQREQKDPHNVDRSEEHTSELQSHLNLVCRLLLEKKKTWIRRHGRSTTVLDVRSVITAD